ncbi:MAG: pantetheine-phosphate adenylyltransferase [Alistipes sp.]|nr:pantetheine-phosphate adenylyltransferase [Alistipes sp.]
MEKIGIFPGSFDPFTRGHEAIVKEALNLFDRVVIAIGYNPAKRGLLLIEARKELIERVYQNEPRVEVTTYTTLTGDEAKRVGAQTMIRSVRNSADFEYERTLERANKYVYPELSTILLLAPADVEHISSSLVRELHAFGHDTKGLLPEGIALEEYLTHEKR